MKAWYALRVKSGTEKKVKSWLEEEGIEHFIPFHNVMKEREGRRFSEEKPLISCLIFVRIRSNQLASICSNSQPFAIYYMRHLETNMPLTVPDKQMQDFIFLNTFSDSIIRLDNENLKQGDKVRVIKGDFAGIEGELIRIKGHKRVVIRMDGLFSIATTYIPLDFLQKI